MNISFKCDNVSTETDMFTTHLQVNAGGVSQDDLIEIFYTFLNHIPFQQEELMIAFFENMSKNLTPYGINMLQLILNKAEEQSR